MKAIKEFYKQLWVEVTQNMQPWFKWTAGVATYAVISVLLPIFTFALLVAFPIGMGLVWIASRIRRWFFK